ncbi:ABC transporter ATP-binding protein [Pseudoflavonifractor sp. 524-17]|uniref:ABC transporter ATP-binding protein n=1 Tax=Pseudoflavonifractor sp. 524-17 TaxID=2304577 RepID=UPI001379DCAF|nr:ABC transporter ATP-binding protein [Pseudoflavonifractor sp. 524-17]NCE64972.1 ABC transporter ATP-binding protein [Pseudoflavonifractor sp. 524-17]
MSELILEMKHITKQFPGVLANDDVNLSIEKGEVHTLLGENGAGKSTLMNVLCGLYHPTSGEIWLEGEKVRFSSAKDAMNRGIGMVHQHFMLIPTLTVVENCLIGARSDSILKLDLAGAAQQIKALADEYNMDVDPMAKVSDMPVGARQRAEIIKALFRGAKILILDEPTAVLTPQETEELFNMVRKLTKDGYTVIFISHKLNEVQEISDRITVLRQGKSVTTVKNDNISVNELARLMVGREVDMTVTRHETDQSKAMLTVSYLTLGQKSGNRLLNDVSFEIHKGEIFGIAGVDGNGQGELVECLTGLTRATSGTAIYKDLDLAKSTTREIMKSGVSHIPQDRHKSGLILSMNLAENMILQDYYQPQFGKGALLNWKYINTFTDQLIQDFQVKAPSRFELAQNLSGGNQQKVIIAREVSREPGLLIAMHPTRGVDVGAIEYIHKRIVHERDQGRAVLLVSTELEEVLKLSDRVAVMYEGEIVGIVKPSEVTVEEMGLMMGGKRLAEIR